MKKLKKAIEWVIFAALVHVGLIAIISASKLYLKFVLIIWNIWP